MMEFIFYVCRDALLQCLRGLLHLHVNAQFITSEYGNQPHIVVLMYPVPVIELHEFASHVRRDLMPLRFEYDEIKIGLPAEISNVARTSKTRILV